MEDIQAHLYIKTDRGLNITSLSMLMMISPIVVHKNGLNHVTHFYMMLNRHY